MLQTVLTSRVAVLGAGAACLLAANVQSGSVIEKYYKDQVNYVYAERSALKCFSFRPVPAEVAALPSYSAMTSCTALQMVNRVGAGFCPEPQPAGPHHIARDSVTDDLDRILMQDQPSKFYYVITGAHGVHNSSSFAFMSAH